MHDTQSAVGPVLVGFLSKTLPYTSTTTQKKGKENKIKKRKENKIKEIKIKKQKKGSYKTSALKKRESPKKGFTKKIHGYMSFFAFFAFFAFFSFFSLSLVFRHAVPVLALHNQFPL